MNTPICDFVRRYAEAHVSRLHMPGHKGSGPLGIETLDITEIEGADSLYEANGIIAQSEKNASHLFGCPTFYSTEGSSQCIRAMVFLISLFAQAKGERPLILAGRNAHKTFLSAVALADVDVEWIYPLSQDSYLSCTVDASVLEELFRHLNRKPTAVYLTSPDYLGNIADIRALSEVCHRYGVWLMIDNAHGAYLKFLPPSLYPIDLGADLCCDSAHKTLPVLTGGAYLHLSDSLPSMFVENAKRALALFGSTSPSYLILQSLDAVNPYLEREFPVRLRQVVSDVQRMREMLERQGFCIVGDEPMKLTVAPKQYGYTGKAVARLLRANQIECEFSDDDFVVLMPTPENRDADLAKVTQILCHLPRREERLTSFHTFSSPERVLSLREALLSPCETIPTAESYGRVLISAPIGCPPAVAPIVPGERIDNTVLQYFLKYGIQTCCVAVP